MLCLVFAWVFDRTPPQNQQHNKNRWKPNDLCEVKLAEDSDRWYLGKIVKTAKDHSKYKVWLPFEGTNKVEVVLASCLRPALKQLGAETFHVLEGSNELSKKGFGGFKSVGGSRPQKKK